MKTVAGSQRFNSLVNGHPRALGPHDLGRALSANVATRANDQPSDNYELIDGKLYVSPTADMPHDDIVKWPGDWLRDDQRNQPELVKRVSCNARGHIPGDPRTTTPEPDLAIYDRWPKSNLWTRSGPAVSPYRVVEVTDTDIDQDFVRNVRLYEQVPSITEYWIIHCGPDEDSVFFRPSTKKVPRWSKDVPTLGVDRVDQTPRRPGLKLRREPR